MVTAGDYLKYQGGLTRNRKGNWIVSYELPDFLYERLKEIASRENTTIARIIRKILEKEINIAIRE